MGPFPHSAAHGFCIKALAAGAWPDHTTHADATAATSSLRIIEVLLSLMDGDTRCGRRVRLAILVGIPCAFNGSVVGSPRWPGDRLFGYVCVGETAIVAGISGE